ncbi:hypothetical protein [Nannocystis pusilla]|uniref:hypothetical protein n=1 Tax=Nannocystis pusilla TaxID=889268 RepID=UPI003B81B479
MSKNGDHLTIPVLRKPAGNDAPTTDRTVAVHRVSLQGETLAVAQLPGAATIAGGRAIQSTIGRCGELIVMPQQNADTDAQFGQPLQLSAWTL